MGGIGKCCCNVCEPCELYEIGSTWSIAELIHGQSYSGTLTEFRELGCEFRGLECKIERNVLYDTCSQTTAWGGWASLYSCGPCLDCTDPDDPIDLPPCPQDINGNVECPPGYPTYINVDVSGRQSTTVKYWYNKQVRLVLMVQFRPGQVRYVVDIGTFLVGSSTAAFAFQQRYRREEFLCTYNTLVSSTIYGDVPLTPPDPIEPCVDLFSLLSQFSVGTWCEDFTETQPDPEGCDTSTVEIVADNPCIKLVGGNCVNVPQSFDVTLLRTVECCDTPLLCDSLAIFDETVTRYVSDWYDCDDVPSPVTLAIDATSPYASRETTLEWSCEDFCELADQTITLPETLTVTVTP